MIDRRFGEVGNDVSEEKEGVAWDPLCVEVEAAEDEEWVHRTRYEREDAEGLGSVKIGFHGRKWGFVLMRSDGGCVRIHLDEMSLRSRLTDIARLTTYYVDVSC